MCHNFFMMRFGHTQTWSQGNKAGYIQDAKKIGQRAFYFGRGEPKKSV